MKRKTILTSIILLILFTLSLLYNPMIYAYIPYPYTGVIIIDEQQRSILKSDCIGWVIPVSRYHGLILTGGNSLCRDQRGRDVYEYIRFNITLPSPGLWVYENVFYFYMNISGYRQIEIVVEKPTSKYSVFFVFKRGNSTSIALNTTRIERYVLTASPGESLFVVSMLIHGWESGKENLRVGIYVSLL